MSETYTAKGSLGAPGSLVYGYRRGDDVPESVVEAWGLVVGEHVSTDGLADDDVPAAPPRPGPEATRADWESYAVATGMSAEDAAVASQDDLEAAGDTSPGRPADSARKAEWVDFVVAAGGNEEWARSGDTTKADLQAWEPTDAPAGPGGGEVQPPSEGDSVAQSANQQANG